MGCNIYGEPGDGFVDTSFDTSYPADHGTDIPEQILPSPSPTLVSSISARTNIQIRATAGSGAKFHLLNGTNPGAAWQWTPLRTNTFTTRGTNNCSVTVTHALNPGGGQFYILQSQ